LTAAVHTHYPDYANPELLEKIPLAARTILDVGCAEGALGAAYLRRNPTARFLGIDIDAASVDHAARRLSEVAFMDVEADPMPFDIPGGIDCIVYGDVLEHLREPWDVVANHREFLTPDGTVLICMPNVEHWSFAYSLLTGKFNYEDQGLFDRTHLRWFTPRTMASLLVDAGLHLSDVSPRPINTEQAERFATALAPALRAIGVEPQEYLNRAGPMQFIWRARRAPITRMVVNATMLPPQGGVSDVRVIEPLRALRTDCAIITTIAAEPDLAPGLPDVPRIAVLHRPLLFGTAGIARVRTLLDKGYIVVSEFDDHPIFMAQRGVDLDQLLTFKAVHAVQTSTPALAEVLRRENPETGMFPNGVFVLPPVVNFADPNQLTMLFAAINRGDDWAPYIDSINEVARAMEGKLRFEVLHDRAFFDALDTPHKNFTPICDYNTYLQKLGSADIAFMPLADTEFNRAKSDLKFVEAGSCRVAALASRVVYENSIEHGRTGLLFHDPESLRASLLQLLAYPDAARQLGDEARNYVAENRMLAYQVADRRAWYQGLWDRREDLNAALRTRVPALFA
jgi:2-polyprenyl-3-methyl-5-hydroxy-6-metoxy-1,4-benzoquinol methylase